MREGRVTAARWWAAQVPFRTQRGPRIPSIPHHNQQVQQVLVCSFALPSSIHVSLVPSLVRTATAEMAKCSRGNGTTIPVLWGGEGAVADLPPSVSSSHPPHPLHAKPRHARSGTRPAGHANNNAWISSVSDNASRSVSHTSTRRRPSCPCHSPHGRGVPFTHLASTFVVRGWDTRARSQLTEAEERANWPCLTCVISRAGLARRRVTC